MKEMPKNSIFLIFSDDIEWCKENFPNISDKFIFIEGNKDYEDLYIMSKCKNNIISNSTFSWWGAWLNQNENKKVVAPLKWFGSSINHNTKDLYCDGWIKI
jgi:5'(3')-deoxyribonucleotidase